MSKNGDNETIQKNVLPRKTRCSRTSCPLSDAKETNAGNPSSSASVPSSKPVNRRRSAINVAPHLSCTTKTPDDALRPREARKAISQKGKPPSKPCSSSLGNPPANGRGNTGVICSVASKYSTGVPTKPFSKATVPHATPDKSNQPNMSTKRIRRRSFSVTDGRNGPANFYGSITKPSNSHSPCHLLYAGPTFVNSPAPSALPIPIFTAWSSDTTPTFARTCPTPTSYMDHFVPPLGENCGTRVAPDTYYPRMITSSWDL